MAKSNDNEFLIKFKNNCQIYPNKLAIISNKEKVSYKVFYRKVLQFQQFFIKKSMFYKHKLIAIDFINSVDSLAFFMAIILIRKIPVLIDPNWSNNQLISIILKYRISCFISSRDFSSNSVFISDFKKSVSLENFFIYYKKQTKQINIKRNCLFVGFTSGTTSLPKAFSIDISAWNKSFIASSNIFKLNKNSVILTLGQMSHGLIFYPIIESLVNGSTVIINLKFERNYFINCVNKFMNISLVLAPIMITKIYNDCSDLLSFKSVQQIITAGSSIDQIFLKRCFKLFPSCYITEYYGASEIGFVGYRKIEKDCFKKLKSFSVFPNVSVKFVKSNVMTSDLNKFCTIWVKSPYLSNGYISNHKSGFKKIGNWASVGDMVLPVSDNSFFMRGRVGDMVISGGKNIYLSEIEDFFKGHEYIENVVVFSINDKYWGDKICAVISFFKDKQISKEQLKSNFIENHESYKFPKQIFISNKSLPLTSSGKINIGELKNSILYDKKNLLIEL